MGNSYSNVLKKQDLLTVKKNEDHKKNPRTRV